MIKKIAELAVWGFIATVLVMSLLTSLEHEQWLRDCAKAHGTACQLVAMPTKTADRVTP